MPGETANAIIEAMEKGAAIGLREAGELLLAAAKENVPEGDPALDPDPNVELRESGKVEVERGGRSVRVSFATAYATLIHEQQSYKHPRGGGAKYLEKPALALTTKLEGIVGSEVKKFFASARGPGHRSGGSRSSGSHKPFAGK
jgi:hypothetical protein